MSSIVKTRLKVVGVDCPTCIYAIEKSINSLGCVTSFKIDVNSGVAEVVYHEDKCRLRDIYRAIRDAGYDVEKGRLYVSVSGFGGEEVPLLESRMLEIRGVLDSRVSVASGIATILYNTLETSRETLESMLKSLGVKPLSSLSEKRGDLLKKTLFFRRITSLAMGVVAISLPIYLMVSGHEVSTNVEYLLAFLAVAALSLNYDIVIRGMRALLLFTPIMDSLISISSLSTLIAGLAGITGILRYEGIHAMSFFEASAGVMGFVGFGRYIEERLRKRASRALEELLASLRSRARVVSDEGIVEKPISEVKPGEIVEVKAGEVVPVDGIVVEGSGYVDESSFTGEPLPRLKRGSTRDPVLAGCILTSGYLRVRATRVGDETLIAYIAETVREAESLKPRLARIADRIVGHFTWVVIAIAATTFTYWTIATGDPLKAVMFMAAVLAVACPCALGIATPLVISVAVHRSSRSGVLIKAGDVFERILTSNTVLLDKTGTLTVGKPALLDIHVVGDAHIEHVLSLLCSVESKSEHPLSRPIVEACIERGIEFSDPEEYAHIPGEGVFGIVGGRRIAAGNLSLIEKLGIQVSRELEDIIGEIGSRGRTPVIVASDSEVLAVLEIGDELRGETPAIVEELKRQGFRVGLASGDVEASVKYFERILKLDFSFWGLKPGDKANLIRDLQGKGFKVVFIGDGVNDAPAISVANVGIAMGGGADVSKEAGDIVILNGDLKAIPFLVKLSRVVKKKMLQNIGWAFIYNVTLIPVAAGLLYHHGIFITPEMAAVAMILSDVSVILNALLMPDIA